uniref:Uncharacterized protein n=1 Tax=Rhizophora mucronata TaxID=61149 RepID=A0A2P2P320_RHIMU
MHQPLQFAEIKGVHEGASPLTLLMQGLRNCTHRISLSLSLWMLVLGQYSRMNQLVLSS